MTYDLRLTTWLFIPRSHVLRGNAYHILRKARYGFPRRAWEPEQNPVRPEPVEGCLPAPVTKKYIITFRPSWVCRRNI